MRNKIIYAVFSLALAFSVPIAASAEADYKSSETGYSCVIEDDADLLTTEEENALLEKMIPVTEYGNAAFKTIDTNQTGTSSYAEAYYHNTFGMGVSGTLFLIDMDNRNIWIFSDGAVYSTVTTSKANTITDNIYTYASNGDYALCAEEAFSEIYSVLNGEKIAEPMKYIGNVLLAITVALFINYLIVKSVSKMHKISDAELVCDAREKMNFTKPRSIKTGTTKRYNPHSDGGGGSGGGGGGGSSGGGGGHSF